MASVFQARLRVPSLALLCSVHDGFVWPWMLCVGVVLFDKMRCLYRHVCCRLSHLCCLLRCDFHHVPVAVAEKVLPLLVGSLLACVLRQRDPILGNFHHPRLLLFHLWRVGVRVLQEHSPGHSTGD